MSLIWTGQDVPRVGARFWNGVLGSLIIYAVAIFTTWAVMRLVDFAVSANYGWRP